ncbi:MAG: hypothetical protein ACI9YT_001977 [Halobacteriales archaeon]
MSETSAEPATYDYRTTDHVAIKGWAMDHGGRPVMLQDGHDEGIGLRFDAREDPANPVDDDAIDSIDWQVFFEHFEDRGLAFAYDESLDGDPPASACDFFERERIRTSNRVTLDDRDDGADGGRARTQEPYDETDRARPETAPAEQGDGRSEKRHEAATDQENADNHRDEPPFQS